MYVEQLRWLPAIPCPKPIHLPPTNFAFLEEGVFLAKMINNKLVEPLNKGYRLSKISSENLMYFNLLG
jgi:hypothetical protein